jgi:hypothetical protein
MACPIADDRMIKNRTAINYYLAVNALVGVVGVACVTGTEKRCIADDFEGFAHVGKL